MPLSNLYPSLDRSFTDAVEQMCARNGWSPPALMAVMDFETAGTYSPSVRNPNSSATGLLQFMEATARELGTTTTALARMSQIQQLAYVEKYLQRRQQQRGPLRGLGDLYMAVFWPAAVGKPDSTVLFRKGTAAYSSNRALDTSGDGAVTRGEAVAQVARRLRSGADLPAPVVASPSRSSGLGGLLLAGLLGAVGYVLSTRYRP